jgi:hypothetical protein
MVEKQGLPFFPTPIFGEKIDNYSIVLNPYLL